MSGLCYLVVLVYSLVLLKHSHGCVSTTIHCCDGHSGSLDAPYLWPTSQSPAGGPAGNPSAAVCYFYRPDNCLICKKGSSTSKCCTETPFQTDDTMYGGPTPYNEYLIGQRYVHSTYGIDWYNLYPRKETELGYYGYNTPTATGRSAMGLHPGTVSEGCVTVKEEDNCWEQTSNILDSGSMTYKNSGYRGFLYVLS